MNRHTIALAAQASKASKAAKAAKNRLAHLSKDIDEDEELEEANNPASLARQLTEVLAGRASKDDDWADDYDEDDEDEEEAGLSIDELEIISEIEAILTDASTKKNQLQYVVDALKMISARTRLKALTNVFLTLEGKTLNKLKGSIDET